MAAFALPKVSGRQPRKIVSESVCPGTQLGSSWSGNSHEYRRSRQRPSDGRDIVGGESNDGKRNNKIAQTASQSAELMKETERLRLLPKAHSEGWGRSSTATSSSLCKLAESLQAINQLRAQAEAEKLALTTGLRNKELGLQHARAQQQQLSDQLLVLERRLGESEAQQSRMQDDMARLKEVVDKRSRDISVLEQHSEADRLHGRLDALDKEIAML